MWEYTDIIVEKKPPVGYITINRPEKQNSLTQLRGGTLDQMAQAYGEMQADSDIRVFIIKGAGPCFSAGFDLGNVEIFEEPDKGWIKGREYEPWARFFTNTTSREIRNNPESYLFPLWEANGGGIRYEITLNPPLPWCIRTAWEPGSGLSIIAI